MRVLVTGANGFVGGALCKGLLCHALAVRGVTRSAGVLPLGVEGFVVADMDGTANWHGTLQDCNAVVHLAARVHVMQEASADPLAEFRRVNVDGTLNLARQAAAAGVRRFVFISSIGVNGSVSFQRPFTADDEAAPHSPYAVSKYEAELGLRVLAAETGLEVVIIRPPLVYGLGAPGNFGALMHAVQRGWPLPLGAIHNKRSLVALDNLVDFIALCVHHPNAANQTFLVSDGEDVSTAELVRRMARAMGKTPRLIPVPRWLLRWGAVLLGRRDVVQRLCGNLQLDISKARKMLGWKPPCSVDEGLRQAVSGLS